MRVTCQKFGVISSSGLREFEVFRFGFLRTLKFYCEITLPLKHDSENFLRAFIIYNHAPNILELGIMKYATRNYVLAGPRFFLWVLRFLFQEGESFFFTVALKEKKGS